MHNLTEEDIFSVAKETVKQETTRLRLAFLIPVVLAILGWAYSLGGQGQEIQNLKNRVVKNEEKSEQVAVIKNDIQYIKKALDDIKQRLSDKSGE